jgi:hypothetical protein
MSADKLILGATKPSGTAARLEKSAAGGIAGVEIVGFPQTLFTRTFGDPDMLFVPLLDAAREAYGMIERLSGHGESRANAVMLTGMHLVSCLLRDPSFSLVARGLAHETTYTVDLNADTLTVNTRLYAVASRRTSFFKVEIGGKISGGPFVVRNPVNGSVMTQIDEQRLRQPNSFSGPLAQECLQAQMQQEKFGRIEEVPGAEAHREVRLLVTVKGVKVPVALRQKNASDAWDIIDGRRQEWVGTLSPEMQERLTAVAGFIQQLFAQS